jgi:polar amino acid transport system permease protein
MIRQFNAADLAFIIISVQWTIWLSLIAFGGGGLLGLGVMLGRISKNGISRYLTIGYIRAIQGTPLLQQLFLAFFLPNIFDVQISPFTAAAVALSVNSSAFLGEIWRGCVESVPQGQWEAGKALGLNFIKEMQLVIMPQAVRIALPPTVGFLVQLIKATSLAAIIGFTEVTRAGQMVVNATFRPFLIFFIVAVCYFALCWPLTLLSDYMERKLKRAP